MRQSTGIPRLLMSKQDLNVTGFFPSVLIPALAVVRAYERSVKQHQNPPPPNVTKFISRG
jgi:hypothetical protein